MSECWLIMLASASGLCGWPCGAARATATTAAKTIRNFILTWVWFFWRSELIEIWLADERVGCDLMQIRSIRCLYIPENSFDAGRRSHWTECVSSFFSLIIHSYSYRSFVPISRARACMWCVCVFVYLYMCVNFGFLALSVSTSRLRGCRGIWQSGASHQNSIIVFFVFVFVFISNHMPLLSTVCNVFIWDKALQNP